VLENALIKRVLREFEQPLSDFWADYLDHDVQSL